MLFSLGERYILIALSLISGVIIARLLTPEEIGLYSVSVAVVGITQVLRDFGVGNFLIQEKNLTDSHVKTAFGLSLIIGLLLFSVVYSGAPLAAEYYNDPRIVDTMRISSLNFLVLPFCSISLALLRRSMAFQKLAYVTVVAASVAFLIGVIFAYNGFGPSSLAISSVSGNVVTGFGTWLIRQDRKVFLPSLTEWRSLLKFGAQSSIASVVTSISMDINDLVLGKILGFASVAMISKAQGMMNMFHRDLMSAVRNVTYPAYAKAHRDGEHIENKYIGSISMVTVFAWPFYGFVSLFSLEIIRLMFGAQWDESASLVSVFCFAGACAATSSLVTSLMMAVGRNDLVMLSELIFQPFRACLIIGAALIFKSLIACATAYLIAFVFYPPFIYSFKERCIKTDYRSLIKNLWLSAKVTMVSLSVPFVICIGIGMRRDAPMAYSLLFISMFFLMASWMSAIVFFKHPLLHDPLFKKFLQYSKLIKFGDNYER